MILKIFSIIIDKIIGYDDEDYTPININRPVNLSYPSQVNLPFSETEYPFSSGFFIIYDGGDGSNRTALTMEILQTCGLKEIRDYMTHGDAVYFTNAEDKKLYEKIGFEVHGCALAACNFNNLKKNEMGKIAFTNENNFYITVRPTPKMEKELLKEVTLFFKGHGYSVDQNYFQENFYSYENYSLRFYVKDEAMAAELGFYIEGKNIGVIL